MLQLLLESADAAMINPFEPPVLPSVLREHLVSSLRLDDLQALQQCCRGGHSLVGSFGQTRLWALLRVRPGVCLLSQPARTDLTSSCTQAAFPLSHPIHLRPPICPLEELRELAALRAAIRGGHLATQPGVVIGVSRGTQPDGAWLSESASDLAHAWLLRSLLCMASTPDPLEDAVNAAWSHSRRLHAHFHVWPDMDTQAAYISMTLCALPLSIAWLLCLCSC